MNENFPTYADLKLKSSRIFESEETKGLTPEQISEGEKAYKLLLEKLEKGEELDEGLFGSIIGGGLGLLAGPIIGKAICKALSIDERGVLGSLLLSKLVCTAIGASIGGR